MAPRVCPHPATWSKPKHDHRHLVRHGEEPQDRVMKLGHFITPGLASASLWFVPSAASAAEGDSPHENAPRAAPSDSAPVSASEPEHDKAPAPSEPPRQSQPPPEREPPAASEPPPKNEPAPAASKPPPKSEPPQPHPAESEDPVSRYPRSTRQLLVNLGFSHWYGGTFGAPIGASTPALVVGVRPGVQFLELRLHYTVALREQPLPTGDMSTVGFANFDALLSHELRVGSARMVLGCGPSIGFVHTKDGAGISVGADLSARYLLDVTEVIALGPFFDARAQLYELPRSPLPLYEIRDGQLEPGHSDMQLQVGVAVSFW
jgi:hypothetical protein